MEPSPSERLELLGLIDVANARRLRGAAANDARAAEAEQRLEARFGTSHALAVYGSLAPGRPNHHVVAPLGGTWTAGVVEGEFAPVGWGASLGFPAFRPVRSGARINVQVLTSAQLPEARARLDAFEGPEYRRILVPVFTVNASGARCLQTVANLYAAADAGA